MARKRTFLRLIAESLAIVLSILLAFGIDAWWDDWQERAQEAEILNSIAVEFRENEDALTRLLERWSNASDAAAEILDSLHSASPNRSATVPSPLISRTLIGATFDPASGALDGVIQSGQLRIIGSANVRERLAKWQSSVQDVREDERLIREIYRPTYETLLAREVDLSALPDPVRLRPSTELTGLLWSIRRVSRDIVRQHRSLLDDLRAVVSAIEQQPRG